VLLLPSDQGGGRSGPYLQKADDLIDPWGNPYVMRVPGQTNYDFDIVSYGADGQPGGEGDDADITN
jgi:general secretion pathway protein G